PLANTSGTINLRSDRTLLSHGKGPLTHLPRPRCALFVTPSDGKQEPRAFADGRKVHIDCREGEALDIVPAVDHVTVCLSPGPDLEADKVVLATGNLPPANPGGLALDHPRYFPNPWSGWETQLDDPGLNVVLFGTGLTMVDAFLTLTALGWWGKIYALSRNGLLPLPHFKGQDYSAFPEGDPTHLSLDEIEGMLMAHCKRLREQGLNPAILVDKLRPYTQRLWQQLSVAEKRRFLKEFRTRWNVTRHRIPEAIHRQLTAAQDAGRLEIIKGELSNLTPCGDGLKVVARSASGPQELTVGMAINCTGPAEGFVSAPSLYRNLLERGLVSVDEVGLGIRASEDFAVIDREGLRSKKLMTLGPPLKGTLWETTAVPELRAQAFRVAEVIVADMHARRAEVRQVEQTYADVVEYSI
ncbi:MAG TPA: hypothetical protein VMG10_25565, partial [Gemmataceae bacterium]|nr:hypothetical protein [Gemmataceae bacterium]